MFASVAVAARCEAAFDFFADAADLLVDFGERFSPAICCISVPSCLNDKYWQLIRETSPSGLVKENVYNRYGEVIDRKIGRASCRERV